MIGQTLGHYRVIEKLGAGGMGVVYRARDEHLNRDVALKFIGAESAADAPAHERLLREARTVSALNHPNICTIYEVSEVAGQAFIVMELIQGQTLREMVRSGSLPAETVVRYGIQIADALEHAHSHRIVHRDLKSENVILTPEGRAKVLDFGLAQQQNVAQAVEATRSRETLSDSGTAAGTLQYIAPEILRGMPADGRSDIWSLGVVLYEMAAGSRPFNGRTGFELSSEILMKPVPALPDHVTPGLEAVILRCLSKDVSQRYQRGSEIRAALQAIESSASHIRVPVLPEKPAESWPTRKIVTHIGIPLAAIAAAVFAWQALHLRGRLFGLGGPHAIHSIAVLPLENLSADPQQEYFADGMTEALTNDLSKIGALRVISRTSAMLYKNAHKPLPQIAKELNVDAVVEGSVERVGNRVKINARLTEANEDRNLWTNSYQRDMSDVLTLQSDVAAAIAGEIRVQLTPRESAGLAKSHPVNPKSYEAYLLGRYLWNKRTPEDLRAAVAEFKKAINLDPTSALAWAGLADGYNLLEDQAVMPAHEAMPLAEAAARKAISLDDSLAEAHASLASVEWNYDWDMEGAGKEFARAIELNPNYATAREWHGLYLAQGVGRFDEAIEELERAQQLDPLSPVIEANVGRSYYYAHRYDKAADFLEQFAARHPDFWIAHALLGQTYLVMGRLPDAIRELEKARSLSPESQWSLGVLGDAYGRAGRRAEALKLADELAALSKTSYVSPIYSAEIYMGVGDRAKAMTFLEKGLADRSDWMPQIKFEPEFDLMRDDPRFQALLKRVVPRANGSRSH